MGSRFVLSISTMGLALATAFAPRAEAQARNPITVCRNGVRVNSEDSHACDRNGGMDLQKTAIARRDAEVRAQQTAQNTNGDDRYGRNSGGYNNGTYSNDGRNDNGRWDDRDNGRWNGHDNGRHNGRNNGRYNNAPRDVYRWQGVVDREVRIQLTDGRAYVPGAQLAAAEIRRRIAAAWPGTSVVADAPNAVRGAGPARYFRLAPDETGAPVRRFGVISPMTEHFCTTCNRLRLSTAGALHACLAHDDAVDLRGPLREGGADAVTSAIRTALAGKRPGHTFQLIGLGGPRKAMVQIGG